MAPVLARLSPGSVFAGGYAITRALYASDTSALYAAATGEAGGAPVILRVVPAAPLIQAAGGDADRAAARFAQCAPPPGEGGVARHLAQVLAAGIDPASETAWVAYEPLTGELVAAALARIEMVHAADLTEIVGQLGAALAPVHARGVAHGGLSPEVLFLSAEHGATHAGPAAFALKLLGFGLASCAPAVWAAPEQLAAREPSAGSTDVDAALGPGCDVWTLGLLVYQLLTGVSYWQPAGAASAPSGLDPRTAPLDPPARRAAAHGLAVFLPPDFDAWFARCVARDASARFASAPAAVAALLPLLAEIAPPPSRTPSRPPSRPPPAPRAASSHDALDAEVAAALREAGAVDDAERLSAAPPPPASAAARDEALAIAGEGEHERASRPSWPDPERRSEPTDISHRRSEPVIALDPSPSKVPPEPVLPAPAAQPPAAPSPPRSHARLIAGVSLGLLASFIVGVLVGRQYPAERADARRADALRLNGTEPLPDPPAVIQGSAAVPPGVTAFGTPPGELPALPTPPVAPLTVDAGATLAPTLPAPSSGPVSLSSGPAGRIYDNHTTSAQVNATQRCTIASLEVALRGTHSCPSDLIVRLRGPSGQSATLQDHDYRNPFRRHRVARFNGTQLEGRWTLSVTDDVGADSGNLADFTLRATCQ